MFVFNNSKKIVKYLIFTETVYSVKMDLLLIVENSVLLLIGLLITV